MPCQAKRVGPESIGFNNLGSRLQILVVNAANQVGLRKIQLVVRAVDEDAFGVEQRPHGAVAQHGGLLDSSKKVSLPYTFREYRMSKYSQKVLLGYRMR